MFNFLCVAISFLLIKYSDNKSRILQAPLIIALNLGRRKTQDGIADLSGKILSTLLWSITTTIKTKMDTPVISLEINLLFIFMYLIEGISDP